MNPYEILGIEKDATEKQIKDAFRILSKQYHPDSQTGNPDLFRKIKGAYDLLMDPSKRSAYELYGIEVDFYSEARESAAEVYCHTAARTELGVPLAYVIREYYEQRALPQLEKDRDEKKKLLDNLRGRYSSIVEKPDNDFLSSAVSKRIVKLDHEYREALLVHDLTAEAYRLLKLYKFDLEQIEAAVEEKKDKRRRTYHELPESFAEFLRSEGLNL